MKPLYLFIFGCNLALLHTIPHPSLRIVTGNLGIITDQSRNNKTDLHSVLEVTNPLNEIEYKIHKIIQRLDPFSPPEYSQEVIADLATSDLPLIVDSGLENHALEVKRSFAGTSIKPISTLFLPIIRITAGKKEYGLGIYTVRQGVCIEREFKVITEGTRLDSFYSPTPVPENLNNYLNFAKQENK